MELNFCPTDNSYAKHPLFFVTMSSILSLAEKEVEYFKQVDADHWRLTDHQLIDTSTVRKDWFAIYPAVNVEGSTLDVAPNDFSFHINEGLAYILPSESYIQLQFSVTKNNAGDVVAPANPISHCLFRSCAYYINNNVIENNKDYNQWRGLVHGLMNYRKSFLDKAGQNLGWALDTPGSADVINKYNVANGNNTFAADLQTFNSGLAARYLSRTSNAAVDTYNVRIPLSELFSFCKEIRTVFRKHQHRIDFSLNKEINSILHRSGGADRNLNHIEIKKMRLWLCIVEPHQNTLAKLLTLFNNFETPRPIKFSPYEIFWRRENMASLTWHLPTFVRRPLHIYFFATDPPKANQDGTSPTVFQNRDMRHVKLLISGIEIPYRGLDCDFTDGEEDYMRAYEMYLQCAGATSPEDQDVMVSYKEFKNNYPIFCFDLTNYDDEIFVGSKNYVVHAEMTAADSEFYAVIVYQQFAYLSMADEGIRIYNKS